MNKIRLIAMLSFVVGLTGVQAQTSITASGGNANGGGGTVSYTVGQIVYTTNTSTSSGSVSQGVQQPYEISVISGIEKAKDISLVCSVYPNPTTDYLTFKALNYDKNNLSFWLYGVNGNLILNKRIEGNETQVSMQNLPSGTYIFKVLDNGMEVKTFKIIKN